MKWKPKVSTDSKYSQSKNAVVIIRKFHWSDMGWREIVVGDVLMSDENADEQIRALYDQAKVRARELNRVDRRKWL